MFLEKFDEHSLILLNVNLKFSLFLLFVDGTFIFVFCLGVIIKMFINISVILLDKIYYN